MSSDIKKDSAGNTIIPSSQRPDGSFRKEFKIRAGYIPDGEIKKYVIPQKRVIDDNYNNEQNSPFKQQTPQKETTTFQQTPQKEIETTSPPQIVPKNSILDELEDYVDSNEEEEEEETNSPPPPPPQQPSQQKPQQQQQQHTGKSPQRRSTLPPPQQQQQRKPHVKETNLENSDKNNNKKDFNKKETKPRNDETHTHNGSNKNSGNNNNNNKKPNNRKQNSVNDSNEDDVISLSNQFSDFDLSTTTTENITTSNTVSTSNISPPIELKIKTPSPYKPKYTPRQHSDPNTPLQNKSNYNKTSRDNSNNTSTSNNTNTKTKSVPSTPTQPSIPITPTSTPKSSADEIDNSIKSPIPLATVIPIVPTSTPPPPTSTTPTTSTTSTTSTLNSDGESLIEKIQREVRFYKERNDRIEAIEKKIQDGQKLNVFDQSLLKQKESVQSELNKFNRMLTNLKKTTTTTTTQ
ncbi:hypothetical protein ACTA71_008916 [Dictyostelium dimigraforme]